LGVGRGRTGGKRAAGDDASRAGGPAVGDSPSRPRPGGFAALSSCRPSLISASATRRAAHLAGANRPDRRPPVRRSGALCIVLPGRANSGLRGELGATRSLGGPWCAACLPRGAGRSAHGLRRVAGFPCRANSAAARLRASRRTRALARCQEPLSRRRLAIQPGVSPGVSCAPESQSMRAPPSAFGAGGGVSSRIWWRLA